MLKSLQVYHYLMLQELRESQYECYRSTLLLGYLSVKKSENTAAAAGALPTLDRFHFLVEIL